MGSLYVSASEIEVFDLCNRKWAFIYIEGKRFPPNESAALGTRVHGILEKWLKDGTAPDMFTSEGEIAAAGLHLLPPPKTPGLVTEERFAFTSQRAWYTGFKDFRYRDANGLLHVGDHKTTKAFTWAKTIDQILYHPQAPIYAVDEFFKNPNDNYLALDWIYYKTTGSRKAEPRFQIVSKETIAEIFFEHIDPVAGEITSLHNSVPQGTSALEFRPDFRACEAFGGCAFLSICNPTPTQKVQAAMTQAAMSLADRIRAMHANRAPSPIHPPEHQAAPAPAVPSVPGIPEAMRGLPTLQQGAVPPQASFMFPTPGAPVTAPQIGIADERAFQVPAAAVPQIGSAVTTGLPVPPPVPGTNPVALVEEAPKNKKRGRPKKDPDLVAAAAALAVEANLTPSGFVLYVGCAPIGSPVTSVLDYVNGAHDEVKKAHGVSHYREMDYGKGPGFLCKELENLLVACEANDMAPRGDVVLGSTQIEEDTASVWISKAAKVVRAFR